jgi:Txe/YoeB family toxin of Txe-Axe toxin-antitoxin module
VTKVDGRQFEFTVRGRREMAHVDSCADCALTGIEIGLDRVEGGIFHDHDHDGSGEHRRQDRVLEPVRKMFGLDEEAAFDSLEKFRGDVEGFYWVRINDRWRVVFRRSEGDAEEARSSPGRGLFPELLRLLPREAVRPHG